jgi:hypothetical protein
MIIVFVKYIILLVGLYAAFIGIDKNNLAAAIVAAGAFISYALIEIQDLKILNKEDDTKEEV